MVSCESRHPVTVTAIDQASIRSHDNTLKQTDRLMIKKGKSAQKTANLVPISSSNFSKKQQQLKAPLGAKQKP